MAPGCGSTPTSHSPRWWRWCGPSWRRPDAPAQSANADLAGDGARRFPQRHRWPGGRVSPRAAGAAAQWYGLRLPQSCPHGAQNLDVRRAGILVVHKAAVPRPLHLVASERRRQHSSRRPRVVDPALEWQSAAGAYGRRLEKAGLRRGEVGVVIPRQPGRWVAKDRRTVLLQRNQILQCIDPSVEARGNEAREHTGDVGAMLRGIKQAVFPLPDDELQGALHDIGIDWRTLYL